MAHILIAEDDADINESVRARLEAAGHRCTQAFSGSEAKLLLENRPAGLAPVGLLVIDLMLPGLTGEELLRIARAHVPTAPVVVISARDTVQDRIDLLRLGADDYLVKPFDLDELLARIEVQLRHRPSGAAEADGAADPDENDRCIRIGAWSLDVAARTLAVDSRDGTGTVDVPLTKTQFGIVALLAEHPNRVFTKQELFETVWGEPYSVEDNTVTAHVSNIRAKLKPTGTDGYIKTVWGIGFKLDAN